MKGCTNLTWAMRGYPNHPKKLGQDTHTIIAKIRIQPTNNGDLMGYITGLLGYIHIYILVGGFSPSEKYGFVSWDYYSQDMEK